MNEVMTVKEASELSGLTEQAIRCGLKAGKLPFGFAFKSDNSKCWSYKIMKKRFKLWLEGEL